MKNFLFPFIIAFALTMLTGPSSAMSALEFLRAETDGKEAPIMKEIVIKLVAKDYKRVPDWARLSILAREKILEKGYINEDIEEVAEEAALGAGMTR